jgi:murein DD-endopeptidase MepM/ murein hydrolase activator NlpD
MLGSQNTAERLLLIRCVIPLTLLALALGLTLATHRLESHSASPYPMRPALRYQETLVMAPVWAFRGGDLPTDIHLPVELSFRSGDTLSVVLSELGFAPAAAEAVISELKKYVDVRRLRPLDRYAALVGSDTEPEGFRLTVSGKGRVEVRQEDGQWRSRWRPFVEDTESRVILGVLDGSLESSIGRVGGETVLAYAMADVLQWDLDFNRDLRLGDRFQILYQTVYLDGEFHRVGDILGLIYENRGRRLEAYRFGEEHHHYDAEGRPLRKLFLRSPLRYSRVTSGFSNRRFHPVLKRNRPHYGIDYGAPTGTPVRVTAGGVVAFVGWDGGGGKTVKVRHPNGYLTAYLHLSRFAGGLRRGVRLTQGEVVGYVGSTGLATAPHLDYRIQKDGRWINPMSLKNEPAEPIPEDRMAEFVAWREELRSEMQAGRDRDDLAGRRPASAAPGGANRARNRDRVGR